MRSCKEHFAPNRLFNDRQRNPICKPHIFSSVDFRRGEALHPSTSVDPTLWYCVYHLVCWLLYWSFSVCMIRCREASHPVRWSDSMLSLMIPFLWVFDCEEYVQAAPWSSSPHSGIFPCLNFLFIICLIPHFGTLLTFGTCFRTHTAAGRHRTLYADSILVDFNFNFQMLSGRMCFFPPFSFFILSFFESFILFFGG